MKRELARVHESDRDYDDYTRAKTEYFDDVQAQFESWTSKAKAEGAGIAG